MILIINESKKDAIRLSDMLYYMGVLSVCATPGCALNELSQLYHAIILMNPEKLYDKESYVNEIRTFSAAPVFAITDSFCEKNRILFDATFKSASYAAQIYSAITDYTKALGMITPGYYKIPSIDASATLNTVRCFDSALSLTKTETMILRALINSYPHTTSARNILKYSFREDKLPEISNIRTHISIINKKFRRQSGRNLIEFYLGAGYRIAAFEK